MQQAKLEIRVRDTVRGTRSDRTCTTPAVIGRRGGDSDLAVEFDAALNTISRSHGTFLIRDGQLQYQDHSSNGSVVDGRPLHRGVAPIREGSIVAVGQFELAARLVIPFSVKLTAADLRPFEEISMPDEAHIDLLAVRDGLHMRVRPKVETTSSMPRSLMLQLTQMGSRIVCEKGPGSESRLISVNKLPVHKSVFELSAMDVVELQDYRLEVLLPDTRVLVCGNPSCHLLNPPVLEQNCTWCGFHLAGGGAISRLIT